jgi:hypothetical protein
VDDYSTRIPELLESTTDRVRSLTVDRAAKVITIASLGLLALVLGIMAVVFLFVGILRILAEVIDKIWDNDHPMEIAYAFFGGLFLVVGAFLWAKRAPDEETTND